MTIAIAIAGLVVFSLVVAAMILATPGNVQSTPEERATETAANDRERARERTPA